MFKAIAFLKKIFYDFYLYLSPFYLKENETAL